MEELELYAYTTATYKREGLVKVGHCLLGRHLTRIREQFGTSNPEHPEFILIGPLPLGVEDKHIHAQLVRNGHSRASGGPGREWFVASFGDVQRAYNEIVFGSSRTLNHRLRREQAAALEKAALWFTKGYSKDVYRSATHPERFLLNAKMRFGKCFTSISLAKTLKAKNTLVVTYKPDVIGEWIETVNEQVSFDGWTGIRAKKKSDSPNDPHLATDGSIPKCRGPIVLCVSLQDLSIDADGKTKERLKNVPSIDWDLVIFDEVHYGSRTDRAGHILNKLRFSKRLDLSGTPFRIIEQDDFCAQQVFTYSYLDEQRNKKEEIASDPDFVAPPVYRLLPDLKISTIEITEQDILQQVETFQSDDIDFSLNVLFETNEEGNFVHDEAVNNFLAGLCRNDHSARAASIYGTLGTQLGLPPIRHSVWWLNRVSSVIALLKKLESHPVFSKFELINASGSSNKDDDDRIIARDKSIIEAKIHEAHENPRKLGTITLTCGRFLTGVTIKQWESILVLNDVKSAESYFQAIFRVQSSWFDKDSKNVKKPVAWVFDFAITRCLRIIYECASNTADQIDQQESYEQQTDHNKDNLEIILSGLCDGLEIKRFIEGSLSSIPTSAKDIFDVLSHEGSRVSLARRITSNVLVNFGSLRLLEENPHLLEILKKIKGYRTQEVSALSTEDLVQIGLDAEKLNKIKKNPELTLDEKESLLEDFVEKERDEDRQNQKRWYATQIKRLAICMADFIYMTYEREYNIDDVIQTKAPAFFEVMTGISKDDFKELCEKGFMNRFALNRIVREFRDQETTSLNPEEYILENINKAS